MLDILRSESQEVAAAPVPGSADLESPLLRSSRDAGMPFTWGPIPPALATLAAGVGLSASRILQEGLADAARHAPGADVRVEVTFSDRKLLTDRSSELRPESATQAHGQKHPPT